MIKIATSSHIVNNNIQLFQKEVESSVELQDRLPYARAWYAITDVNGKWQFGPSKFVGYEDLNAEQYIEIANDIDGRRTEVQLQQWFETVQSGSVLADELESALVEFLAHFGKAPSTKARINVLRNLNYETSFLRQERSENQPEDYFSKLVELMIAISKTLPAKHLRDLKLSLPK